MSERSFLPSLSLLASRLLFETFKSFQLIQTSGGLQKLLAFAAESTIPEVQQHAVCSFNHYVQPEAYASGLRHKSFSVKYVHVV